MLTKAITHLKLDWANSGKLTKLDDLAAEYLRVTQAYCDWLIAGEVREPDKYADLPAEIKSPLSARWQRCAWQQACGIAQSWYSNERTNPPVLHKICIQANTNVVVIERSESASFDYWLRISTLEKGNPVRVPLRLYPKARQTLEAMPDLCTGVTLNQQGGQWYVTFVVEQYNKKPAAKAVVGVDIGMATIVATSTGGQHGQISHKLRRKVEKAADKRRRKQKLNACLKKKGQPTVSLDDDRAEAYARNEIGQALNAMLDEIPTATAIAVERLSVKDMKFKSRQMNRALKASQLGYTRDRLKFKLDERGIRYRSVQPAYSSQQCSHCGFTLSMNRRTQADFECLWCGYQANADVNAAANLAERFSDEALNKLPFRDVETVLALRFMRRLSDARSASAGLEP